LEHSPILAPSAAILIKISNFAPVISFSFGDHLFTSFFLFGFAIVSPDESSDDDDELPLPLLLPLLLGPNDDELLKRRNENAQRH
jgi:hypothetical protein